MKAPATIAALLLLAVASLASAQTVTTIAGSGAAGAFDGPVSVATFNRPTWLDFDRDSNAIYVVDRLNGVLRRIAGGSVETRRVIGSGIPSDSAPFPVDFGGALGGGIAIEPPAAGCGASIYAHGMFVANSARNTVMQLADVPGYRLTFANRDLITGTQPNTLANPTGLALSWGYTGRSPQQDAVFVAETGAHTIRRIGFVLSFEGCSQPFTFATFAGAPNEPGFADGDRLTARFNTPRGLVAGPDGSVYVADSGNHVVRRIAPDGRVTTIAGEPGVPGSNDGIGRAAHLMTPSGIDIDAAGNLYIADTGNHTIRRLSPDGMLTTIAGKRGEAGFADGAALEAQFNGPVGVKLVNRTLLIADTSNNAIRALQLDTAPRRRVVRK